jgi:hypothetical protein
MKPKSSVFSFLSNSAAYKYVIVNTVDIMRYVLVLFSLQD